MNRREIKLDWPTVLMWGFFVLFGWINVFAASVRDQNVSLLSIFDISHSYGKQFIFILAAMVVAGVLVMLETKVLELLSYTLYGLTIVLLLLVLVIGRDINGARGWIDLGGPFKLQPAEFAKIGTAMAVAAYMSRWNFSFKKPGQVLGLAALIAAPPMLIMLQPDAGSTLVFMAFVLMLFREGLSPVWLILGFMALVFAVLALLFPNFVVVGIVAGVALLSWLFLFRRRYWGVHLLLALAFSGLVMSVDFVMQNILKPHQKTRVLALFNPSTDPLGTGWNITQSKIAIGSGGFIGKGFLQGTQTKFDFVPEQDTDFIFCTIGEEYGWLGSIILLGLFFAFLSRLLYMAETSRTKYARIYGYSAACIFFVHVAINIGMTIGVMPVIGIPLPFFSYGGSSLLSFTILLFVLLNHHANRSSVLSGERY